MATEGLKQQVNDKAEGIKELGKQGRVLETWTYVSQGL